MNTRILINFSTTALIQIGAICLFCTSNASRVTASAELPGTGRDKGKTVVYRDTWGVPHIYAPTTEEGLFAMGWAQAEDRPEELLKNMLRGMGELASVEGPTALDNDKIALMWDLYKGSKALADRVTREVRVHVQAFVRGINSYYENHPRDIPSWWTGRRVDEFMVMAYSRLFLQSYSFDQGLRDLQRGGIDPGIQPVSRGSNQFVIAPNRTALAAPILLGDMHLPYDGPFRFWELRIHAGGLHGSGFTLPGIPYIGIGHNGYVAWAMTTGGPDAADVYELRLDKDGPNPDRYLYDGQWKKLRRREYVVNIKGIGKKLIRFYDSHYGPLAGLRNRKGYAIRSSYADAVDVLAPLYEFNLAKSYKDLDKGLALQQLFPHNFMAADNSGNIYYQRTGRVPKRPDGYDWSKPVDGSTSRTEWLGIHPTSDLLQATNPSQGYMQNCNVPPDAMMENSPFVLRRTRPYIFADASQQSFWGYGTRDGWTNSRGARVVELLSADSQITVQKVIDTANDIRPFGARDFVEALLAAHDVFGTPHLTNPDYVQGIQELRAWNFELSAISTAALKYSFWRRQLIVDIGGEHMKNLSRRIELPHEETRQVKTSISLNRNEQVQLIESFKKGMAKMRLKYGTLDRTYGDVFRVGRGESSWPCDGGMSESLGLTTVRSVQYGPEHPDLTCWARAGQTSTTIAVLTMPIQSWSCVPMGQSDRPNSPHFCDQAEKLFSRRQMKRTWWTPGELVEHIESRELIVVH